MLWGILILFAVIVGFGFFRVTPLLVIAGTVVLALSVVAVRSPFLGILLVTFFLPFERIGAYETSFGTIRLSQVFLLATLAGWLLAMTLGRISKGVRNPILLPLLAFSAVNVIGLTVAPNIHYALQVLALTFVTVIASWLLPKIIRTEAQCKRLVVILLISATTVSVFGIFQFLGDSIGLPSSITGLRELYTKKVFGFPRVQSTALEPLYFANYLLLPIGIVFAQYVRKNRMFPKWIMFLLFGLFAGNLGLTVSRGGYLALAATIITVCLLALPSLFRLRMLLPLGIGALVVGIAVLQFLNFGDVSKKNLNTFNEHVRNVFSGASFAERADTIGRAEDLFLQSPLIGVGPGQFGPSVAAVPQQKPESGWLIVNNETFELLAETGIFGFLSILFALFILLMRSVKALAVSSTHPQLATLHIGLLGALVGIVVQYQTFSVLYIMQIWFCIGLLLVAQNILLSQHAHVVDHQ